MAGELCPYCGTLLTTSLRFCVSCRRSVTESKIKQAGAGCRRTPGDDENSEEGRGKFRLSRKTTYAGVRQARMVFTTLTTMLAIIFVYFFTMKFMIHKPIPFEQQVTSIIDDLQKHNRN